MKLVTYILWGAAAIIALWGFQKLERTEQEKEDFIDSSLPREVFVRYNQIGHVYGRWAGDYWKLIAYERNFEAAKHIPMASDVAADQVRKATNYNFAISPDPARDERIVKRYNRIRENYTDIIRRDDIAERRKDFFAYFGGASMVGIVAFFVGRSSKQQSTTP